MRCRYCNCHETNACVTEDGPCYWHKPGYCSACAEKHLEQLVDAAFSLPPDFVEHTMFPKIAGLACGIEIVPGKSLTVTDHIGVTVFRATQEGVYLAPHYDALELLGLFKREAA